MKNNGLMMIMGGDEDRKTFWQTVSIFTKKLKLRRRIVVLAEEYRDYKKWLHFHERRWRSMGYQEIRYFLPKVRDDYSEGAVTNLIRWADVIFIFGGDTRKYHRYYCTKMISRAMREAHLRYGKTIIGLSAGALLFPRRAIIWGSKISKGATARPIRLQANIPRHRGGGGEGEFRMGRGFGLIDNIVVDVHFAERGRRPRLAHALSLTKRAKHGFLGIGLDVNASAILFPDGTAKTLGSGGVTLMRFKRPSRGKERAIVEFQCLKVGDKFRWRDSKHSSD